MYFLTLFRDTFESLWKFGGLSQEAAGACKSSRQSTSFEAFGAHHFRICLSPREYSEDMVKRISELVVDAERLKAAAARETRRSAAAEVQRPLVTALFGLRLSTETNLRKYGSSEQAQVHSKPKLLRH
eukprot:2168950-Amphidinium_carterae.1